MLTAEKHWGCFLKYSYCLEKIIMIILLKYILLMKKTIIELKFIIDKRSASMYNIEDLSIFKLKSKAYYLVI